MAASNHVGQRFGRLKVLKFSHRDKYGCDKWTCICTCGKEKVVQGSALRLGSTQSCGCLARETVIRRNKTQLRIKKGTAFRNLLNRYRNNARLNSRQFLLSPELFKQLTKSRCSYCGEKPKLIIKSKGGEIYKYNGVDRINSQLDYLPENCVPCCSACNRMKSDLPRDLFLKQVNKIALYTFDEE